MAITTQAQQILGEARFQFPDNVPEKYWELLGQYREELIAQACEVVGNREDAEDIVQNTFCDAFRDTDKLPATGSIGAWLRSINHCNALNFRRGKGRAAKKSDRLRRIEGPTQNLTTGGFSIVELRESMNKAIESLPEHLREAVRLRYFENLTFVEIAQKLSIPVGTVQSRLYEASNRLYGKLKPHFSDSGTKP